MYPKLNWLHCILLLLICIPEINTIHFFTKDLALAAILGGILKPRFVPLPIPFPLPFTVSKHIHKPYPIPLYSQSAYAHQVDQWPQGLDSLSNLDSLTSGTHALAQLHSASENIDSIVKQLSLSSSDIHKESESLTLPTIHNGLEEYESYDDFTSNFSDDWWRK